MGQDCAMDGSGAPDPYAQRMSAALGFIEANLGAPLTLGQIAERTRLSPYHFARLFTAIRGESVMAYVWRRRLQTGAERIARDPGVKLIDLAFDCGFESQEAFTRAFKRLFGVAPGQFKRAHIALQPLGETCMPSESAANSTIAARVTMRPAPVQRPAFRVAGMQGEFRIETRPGIPLLWERFVPYLPFAGMAGEGTYGVCWDMAQDRPFQYMAGAELAANAPTPNGLSVKEIPAQAYLVFRQELDAARLQPQVTAAMEEIWGRRMPALNFKPGGGPDFEYYPRDFEPGTKTWIEYWIPVAA